jgi:hypothetical protein
MTLSSIIKSQVKKLERDVARYLEEIEFKHTLVQPKMPSDFKKFNDIIGLPSLYDGSPGQVFSYQQEIDDAINEHHRVIINKSRKIGVTETVLRSIAKNCFGRYAGFNVMIIAGNRQAQAEELLSRFANFFEKGIVDLEGNKYKYHDIIKHKTKSEIVFFNDTKIRVFPASAEALRGPERVICIFFDEAAHVNLLDDSKVYDALKPNLANTNGDFIMVSTPNGLRGIFHDLWVNGNFNKLEFPYTRALGKLLTQSFIDAEKKDPRPWYFKQEYECQWVAGGNTAIDPSSIKYTPRKVQHW